MTLSLLPRFRAAWGVAFRHAPDSVPFKTGSHLPALDAVRGLAILMVTLYRFSHGHSIGGTSGKLLSLLDGGFRGVDLFFVLSGFLITGILHDAKGTEHYFRNFYMRRTLRIFPLYYGVLAVVFLIFPFFGTWASSLYPEASERQIWLWTYGTNLYQSVTGEWAFGQFNHFWSLAVEEHFYLLWPLVIYSLSRVGAMRASAVAFIACYCARVAWLVGGGNDTAAEVLTLFRADSLVAGAWLALAVRSPEGSQMFASAARIGFIVSGIGLAVLWILNRRFLTAADPVFLIFFGSFIALAVSWPAGTFFGRILRSRFLEFLGKYSYGMYVFQNLLVPVLASVITAERLGQYLQSPVLGRLAYIFVMSCATAGLAFLSYHAFEKHFLRLKSFFAAPQAA